MPLGISLRRMPKEESKSNRNKMIKEKKVILTQSYQTTQTDYDKTTPPTTNPITTILHQRQQLPKPSTNKRHLYI